MLLGSLCCNVYLLRIEKKLFLREQKFTWPVLYEKVFFNVNLYALPYADPRGFRRGYTGFGAQTKYPILMMNWHKKTTI